MTTPSLPEQVATDSEYWSLLTMKQEQDKLVMYGALHAARGALEVAWAHADPDSEGYRRLEAIHELVRLLAGDLARECGL